MPSVRMHLTSFITHGCCSSRPSTDLSSTYPPRARFAVASSAGGGRHPLPPADPSPLQLRRRPAPLAVRQCLLGVQVLHATHEIKGVARFVGGPAAPAVGPREHLEAGVPIAILVVLGPRAMPHATRIERDIGPYDIFAAHRIDPG